MTPEQLIARYEHDRKAGKLLNPCLPASALTARKGARSETVLLHGFPVTTAYHVPGDEWAAGHHTGEDHACPIGSLALAVSWGHVVAAGARGANGYGAAYGNLVVVRTRSGRYDYLLAHLSVIKVRTGDQVRPGQVIGLTGATGHVTGPHLHFEARPAGGHYGSDITPIHVKQKGH